MSPMVMLGVIWAVITTALVIVLIYRSTLSMHEDDQLFIDESTANLRAEQEALLKRMNQITPIVRILAAASGLLILVIAGMWVYAQMNRPSRMAIDAECRLDCRLRWNDRWRASVST